MNIEQRISAQLKIKSYATRDQAKINRKTRSEI